MEEITEEVKLAGHNLSEILRSRNRDCLEAEPANKNTLFFMDPPFLCEIVVPVTPKIRYSSFTGTRGFRHERVVSCGNF